MTEERTARNNEIRKNIDILVNSQKMTHEQAFYHLKNTYGLRPDTIRKIYYDTNYETRYEEKKAIG